MKIRVLARVITYDKNKKKILLVKNRLGNYWYPPGGEWEYEKENILETAKRETREETGFDVEILKFLYAQEFHATKDTAQLETFWLAKTDQPAISNKSHIDSDPNGNAGENEWFSKEELKNLKVFPERLKNSFWDNIDKYLTEENPFIGVF